MEVPVVDFSAYELENTILPLDNLEKLSDELRKAFTEVGFVYLRNTGIHQDEVCYFLLVLLVCRWLSNILSIVSGGQNHGCFKEVLLFARKHEETFQQGQFRM